MSAAIDITGKKFGKLLAVCPTDMRSDAKVVWKFVCDCGREMFSTAKSVVSGNTKSCGCLIRDTAAAKSTRVTSPCQTCGAEIKTKKSHAERGIAGVYCSKACMAAGYKTRMLGSSNPNYRGVRELGALELRARDVERRKRYAQANPEVIAASRANSRAKRRMAPGKHSAADIAGILSRQDGRCAACRCEVFGAGHIDHIIPIALGGSNFVGNLQILCAPCNLSKKTMLPVEYKYRVLKGGNEEAEQAKVLAWSSDMSAEIPRLSLLFHPANGGYRTKATAIRMRAIGVKKGVPDLVFPVPAGQFYGLFIELKVGRNKPTVEQHAWLAALNDAGYMAVVRYGAESAISTILDYLALGPPVPPGIKKQSEGNEKYLDKLL